MRKGSKSFAEGGCGGRDSMGREHYIVEADGQVRTRNNEQGRDYYIKRGGGGSGEEVRDLFLSEGGKEWRKERERGRQK